MPYQETVAVYQTANKEAGTFYVYLDTARGRVTLAEFPYSNVLNAEFMRETMVAERVERYVATLPWPRTV